jgi:hypothetical protein
LLSPNPFHWRPNPTLPGNHTPLGTSDADQEWTFLPQYYKPVSDARKTLRTPVYWAYYEGG